MAKIGVHAHIWIDKWTTKKGNFAIKTTAETGFDILEIPLKRPDEFDADAHKKAIQAAGIEVTASLSLPERYHMTTNPKGAIQFLTTVLQKLQDAGGSYLCGCIAYAGGKFTNKKPTQEERQIVIDSLGEVALLAKKMGMSIGLEVLSRNDTYLYNTLADARETILAVGMDNLNLHADTYHMNIEEEGSSITPIKASCPPSGEKAILFSYKIARSALSSGLSLLEKRGISTIRSCVGKEMIRIAVSVRFPLFAWYAK